LVRCFPSHGDAMFPLILTGDLRDVSQWYSGWRLYGNVCIFYSITARILTKNRSRSGTGNHEVIDFRETAPMAATEVDRYLFIDFSAIFCRRCKISF